MRKILMVAVLAIASELVVGCNLLNVEGDVGSNNSVKADVKIDSGATVLSNNKVDSGATVLSNNNTVVNIGIPACASWNKKLGYVLHEGHKTIEWEETNTSNAPNLGKHLDASMTYFNVIGLDRGDAVSVKAEIGPYTEYMIYELGIVIYRSSRGIDYVYVYKNDGSLKWWTLFKLSEVLK